MKVLLDECLPRRLARAFVGHEVATVAQAGWAGISNGRLLALIEGRFDAFVTMDKNPPAQQTLDGRSFGVIVLKANSNRLADLQPLVPAVLAALASLQPGMVVRIP